MTALYWAGTELKRSVHKERGDSLEIPYNCTDCKLSVSLSCLNFSNEHVNSWVISITQPSPKQQNLMNESRLLNSQFHTHTIPAIDHQLQDVVIFVPSTDKTIKYTCFNSIPRRRWGFAYLPHSCWQQQQQQQSQVTARRDQRVAEHVVLALHHPRALARPRTCQIQCPVKQPNASGTGFPLC